MIRASQRDQILRLMRDLTQALQAARTENPLDALRDAERALLGPMADIVPRMDADTAAQMLGEPLRIAAFARLLHERAALGGPGAKALAARAVHMAAAARARLPADDPGVEDFIGGWG
ncbi:hypothetical protein [Longimicrobium terrae]|uniref:Uncharacterized protein n=1 Tax=Longimicrobium terrae TaxID=1639882 RepID=A0A841H8B6_9BACT|nr:hypothetical protein [Longimicrobium terrae]MBB4639558.1 hypothetical protein [Longimicrobium terrae]MBB6073929.1 hypothetical protein [Longimicrobium terrae]NNC30126.1 hypothetical protein [Longimicrobium terrae]